MTAPTTAAERAYKRGAGQMRTRLHHLEAENARLKAELLRAALLITQLRKKAS